MKHLLWNDWMYWVGRGLLRLLGIRGVAMESLADEPVQPFPAWPKLWLRDADGVLHVTVFAQMALGGLAVALGAGVLGWAWMAWL
jgi:hypothetical protein